MTLPTDHFFNSQRLRLHYAAWGPPGAAAVILVHGARDNARTWDNVAAVLAEKYRVIAPDLRGHGDSAWEASGLYAMPSFMFDLAELIRHLGLADVNLVGHSLGGNIALRLAGVYPETVRRVVSMEGLGPSPAMAQQIAATPVETRLRGWVDEQRQLAARKPRVYATLDEALDRMQAQNPHLTPAQARHLTEHGVRPLPEGGFVWKFDPYLRSWPPVDLSRDDIRALWSHITCPVLLVYGSASWASNPATDGRASAFRNATVSLIDGAGHWLHHDRLTEFVTQLQGFLE